MIIMDLRLDNFLAFNNFHINMSYPKKIVNSSINNEHLMGYSNFRYKKVNILMGTNATGKTSLGLMIMTIFNFIDHKEVNHLLERVNDPGKKASFSIDFVNNEEDLENPYLYRVEVSLDAGYETENDLFLSMKKLAITRNESYEKYALRLEELESYTGDFREQLSLIDSFGWLFRYPSDSVKNNKYGYIANSDIYTKVLRNILCTMDSSIIDVEKSEEVENSYLIKKKNKTIIMQDGVIALDNYLSSGTKAGVHIAEMITSILERRNGFYYCDEKFTYVQSDIEKACLSLMIQNLGNDEQLFFTTHNLDVLDISLPKHSFMFLRKSSEDAYIECICASEYIKKNTESLRNAVDNDLFSIAPNLDLIYELENLSNE